MTTGVGVFAVERGFEVIPTAGEGDMALFAMRTGTFVFRRCVRPARDRWEAV